MGGTRFPGDSTGVGLGFGAADRQRRAGPVRRRNRGTGDRLHPPQRDRPREIPAGNLRLRHRLVRQRRGRRFRPLPRQQRQSGRRQGGFLESALPERRRPFPRCFPGSRAVRVRLRHGGRRRGLRQRRRPGSLPDQLGAGPTAAKRRIRIYRRHRGKRGRVRGVVEQCCLRRRRQRRRSRPVRHQLRSLRRRRPPLVREARLGTAVLLRSQPVLTDEGSVFRQRRRRQLRGQQRGGGSG